MSHFLLFQETADDYLEAPRVQATAIAPGALTSGKRSMSWATTWFESTDNLST